LVFITIFAYGFLFHERKRLFMLFLLYAGVLAVFAFGVYQLGRAQGLLEVWGRELKGEYLYKSIDEVPMSFTTYDNLRNLFLWWLVGACFLPFGLRFRRGDKLGQLLIVTLIVFLGIVLISAESRVYRSHYAAPLTLLTLAAVLRYWFCKSGPKSNREKCTRLALIFVAIVSTIYLLLYPFDYPEYNTLWPGGYYLLSGLHETIGRSIVK
jgi:hypothetical protein